MSLRDRMADAYQRHQAKQTHRQAVTQRKRLDSEIELGLKEDDLASSNRTLNERKELLKAIVRMGKKAEETEEEYQKRVTELTDEILKLNEETDKQTRLVDTLKEAHKAQSEELRRGTKQQENYTRSLIATGSAKGALGQVTSQLTSKLSKNAAGLATVLTLTHYYNLRMQAATKGTRDYLNAGAVLPKNQEELNVQLAEGIKKWDAINARAAVMSNRYGIAKDRINDLSFAVQEQFRFQARSGEGPEAVADRISDMTENIIQAATIARVDVNDILKVMSRRRWDMKDEKTALAEVTRELRVVKDVMHEINKNAPDIFPDDFFRNINEAIQGSTRYYTSMEAVADITARAYTESGKLGASYRQQLEIGKQMVRGLQGVTPESAIGYISGQSMLRQAKLNQEEFLAQIKDEGQRTFLKGVLDDRGTSDYTKTRILQETLGESQIGIRSTLETAQRYSQGQVGAEIFKNLFGFSKISDAYAAQKIFMEKGTKGIEDIFRDMKERGVSAEKAIQDATNSAGGSLLTEDEKRSVQTLSARQEGFTWTREAYEKLPDGMKSILDKLTEIANSVDNAPTVFAALLAWWGITKVTTLGLGTLARPIAARIVGGGMGGGSDGFYGTDGGDGKSGKGKGKGGRGSKARGRMKKGLGVAGALYAGWELMGRPGLDRPEDVESPEEKQSAEETHSAVDALSTGLGVVTVASMIPGVKGLVSKGAGTAVRAAGTAGRFGLDALIKVASSPAVWRAAGVAGAGMAGYQFGAWADEKIGASDAVASGTYKATQAALGLVGKGRDARELRSEIDEASRYGLNAAEWLRYKYGDRSAADLERQGYSDSVLELAKQAEGQTQRPAEELLSTALNNVHSVWARNIIQAADEREFERYGLTGAQVLAEREALHNTRMAMSGREAGVDAVSALQAVLSEREEGSAMPGPRVGGRSPSPGSLKMRPSRVDPGTGTMHLEVPEFYSLLETWNEQRSIFGRLFR